MQQTQETHVLTNPNNFLTSIAHQSIDKFPSGSNLSFTQQQLSDLFSELKHNPAIATQVLDLFSHSQMDSQHSTSSEPNSSSATPSLEFSSSNSSPSKPLTFSASSGSSSSSGHTYYVSTSGDDHGDGSADHPWRTIQHAVDGNAPIKGGDTVLVQPGTYSEEVSISKSGSDGNPITLKANGDVTIVDPNPTGGKFEDGSIQTKSGVANLTIDGFTIKDSPWAGIALHDGKNIVVQNNHTENSGSSGVIALPGSYYGGGEAEVTGKNIKVLNNTINNANSRYVEGSPAIGQQEALSIWGVDGFEVAGNKVTNGKTEGIDIKVGSRNGTVHDNEVSGSAEISGTSRHGGPAIYIDGNRADMFNIDVFRNNVHNNHADGISVADEDPSTGSVRNVRVHDNVISNNGTLGANGGQGISVYSTVDGLDIYNNVMRGNIEGFDVGKNFGASPQNVSIHDNQFLDNRYRPGVLSDGVNGFKLVNNKFSGARGTNFDREGTQTNVQTSGNVAV